MEKLKVMTVVGTRPEIIRLSECIKACDKFFDHTLCHTGQNWDYTLNEIFFRDLDLREPDYYLKCVGKDLGETMGNVIAKSYALFQEHRPNALLILGDTNSALCAIAAKRLKIPIFHMEAGNRCFDQNVPEEINRKIVDHISDINLPYTEHSRRHLISEGIDPQHIFVTGSPMREVLEANMDGIEKSTALAEYELNKHEYIILSAHREENVDNEKNFLSLMNGVNAVAEETGKVIIFSTHPRSRNRIEESGFIFHPNVKSFPPFGFHDYICLQKHAYCVLSDSGTLSEESAILGFPAVLIRTSTERPEVVDKGTCIVGGITTASIIQSMHIVCDMWKEGRVGSIVADYEDNNVSEKVVRIIQGYVPIVNERVWRK
ncbi:UDP-N-acetylglucosamine 2-epimerase (non-hydrolyzing) [Eubacteriales bacterium OttesenSCG-928-M02]|nr:UDP-N-acetylglucosamine 2-epimerase (non-hydrolyzing) [Eubacteriales bacterium OttesenSCG-928-M02]